jgi:hypothetical protein
VAVPGRFAAHDSTRELLGDRSGAGGTADLESAIVNSMSARP